MIQTPLNPYMQVPVQAPSYNAVKIDVHNPSVNAPTQPCYQQPTPAQMPVQDYSNIYAYPQTQLYSYPQAQTQPYYQQPVPVQTPVQDYSNTYPQAQIQPAVVNTAPVIQQQNINAPAPQITNNIPEPKSVEIVPPEKVTPQIDINSFIAKLTNADYEVQANAMEDIANMINTEPQKAVELLDEKIINTLNSIMTVDTSKLAGPSPQQLAAREKIIKGEQVSENEKKLASEITPMEQAERNKSYAMFTAAIMQKLFVDEVKKLTNSTVPLTEVPGAAAIVEQLKNNPNPMVRASAIEALSYIQTPEYKQDLNTLFSIAKNDQDKNVQEAAATALNKLDQLK